MAARRVNWDDLPKEAVDREGYGVEYWKSVTDALGLRELGLSRVRIPPGKMACPRHEHSREEELFVVLEGSGTLLDGEELVPLRAGDVVSCLPGWGSHGIEAGPDGIEYLAISNRVPGDWCWYPDSGKVLVEGLYRVRVDEIRNYYFGEARAGRFGTNPDRADDSE